ncbi:hypothetical protein PCANC_23255 [Puccinia coronata f. sp. avenae]|uniref:Uncharacterized protein n=1 Tax=Puccinia coronata f. sp. avenae TaxID=200324 RepID=A0A2N5TRL0_9BASI|nr:hypothetical protein PCANC_23255 [Puccinia coronata f. sp. avenae]
MSMASIDLSSREPKSPQNDSLDDLHDDTPNDSSCSMVTDDTPSSLPSSESASSPCPQLPRTPPRLDIQSPSIRAEQTVPRGEQQFWSNLHDPQTSSCAANSINIAPGLARPSAELVSQFRSPHITHIDTASILLQPPTHAGLPAQGPPFQPASHTLPYKSLIPQSQSQLGTIPLSSQWVPNALKPNTPLRFGNVDDSHCHVNNLLPAPCYIREEMDEPETDPFSQLSARTLALMDQPESEVTIYDCEYCDKTYQGKHARSIWRRHLSDKHKIPLSTQPRRTRWDNDVNRPKTEEERRERTLESKRRWARKNRAAKKAAREGQRSSLEHATAMLYSKSLSQNQSTPNRSRAPSPTLYQSSLGHTAAGSPKYFAGTDAHSHSQPLQVNPCRSSVPIMSRGSSTPQPFSHYLPMGSHTPFSIGDTPYNPSFSIGQGAQTAAYSFGDYSVPLDAHSTFQFSDRCIKEESNSSYSPHPSQTHISHPSPPETYATDVNTQEIAHPHDLPDCYPSAPLNFQYSSWELGSRFNFGTSLPSTQEETEPLSYESHPKRQRLCLSSSAPVPLHQFEDLQKAYSTCNLEVLSGEGHDYHPVSAHDPPSISSGEVVPLGPKRSSIVSVRDEEAESESSSIAEQRTSLRNEQGNSYCMFDSPMDPTRRHEGLSAGQNERPATAGTLSTFVQEHQHPRIAHLERAATEPQFSARHDLQTPLRETGLRSDGRLHLSHSPICRMDAPGLDSDLLSSPGTRADPITMSLYQGHYAPMSAGKGRPSESHHMQSLSTSCPSNAGDWNTQALQTPSAFSRFPFSNSMLSSPAGGAGLFGSPSNILSKSLGLTMNNNPVSGEDLGGLLAGSSAWDMVHQRS